MNPSNNLIITMGYFAGGECKSEARLDGKTVVITGGNTGIGRETAVDVAQRGARTIIACRSKERGESALESIKQESGSQDVYLRILDLASQASVRNFASDYIAEEPQLDILINNAGIMMCPYSKTEDGIEMQFGTNHIGHFLLTMLLLDKIKSSAPARIVNVSSLAHKDGTINFEDINSEKSYSEIKAYRQSKLANVLFTRSLHERLAGSEVTTYSLHPGVIKTELSRHVSDKHPIVFKTAGAMFGWMMKNPKQGAQTNVYCAVQEGIEPLSGRYFSDCAEKQTSKEGRDMAVAEQLWNLSLEMSGLTDGHPHSKEEQVEADTTEVVADTADVVADAAEDTSEEIPTEASAVTDVETATEVVVETTTPAVEEANSDSAAECDIPPVSATEDSESKSLEPAAAEVSVSEEAPVSGMAAVSVEAATAPAAADVVPEESSASVPE